MSDFTFEGFEPSNTTPVPDIFFDRLMVFLTDAQLRVLLYIIRRTLGFKKTADYISLKQFRYGIKTKGADGQERQLDFGCGLKSMKTIVQAARDLEKMGCIERDKSKASAGDDNTTKYRIKFRSAAPAPVPVGGTSLGELPGSSLNTVPTSLEPVRYFPGGRTGTSLEEGRVLPPGNPQETVIQETVKQETVKQERIRGDEHAPLSPASLILPYNDFLFLDDLERPTLLTVVLTSKEDSEQYDTTPIDDSREFVALEVRGKLAALGHTVAYKSVRPKQASIVESAPAPKKAARKPKKAALEGETGIDQVGTGEGDQAAQEPAKTRGKRTPSRSVEKTDLLAEASEAVRFVVGEWLAIFPDPRPVTKYVIEKAEEIAAYNPEPGEVAACRRWQYANDTNGYYKRRGHDIGDVARDFGKFRSLKNAPAPAPAPQGGSRSGRPAPAPAPAPDQGDQVPTDQDATAAALAKLEKMRTEKKTTIKPTGPAAAAIPVAVR
jgi:hypothetical protein